MSDNLFTWDMGLCYDAANAPDVRRLSGPADDTPPADWTSPGESNTPWTPNTEGPAVETWSDATGYSGGQVTGTGDTITSGSPCTLDDSGGAFTSAMVGRFIQFSGCSNGGNNGTFPIVAVNSATQLTFTNGSGVTETSSFSYTINPSDNGYGSSLPTKSWRHDVDHPEGWYTRITRSEKISGPQ